MQTPSPSTMPPTKDAASKECEGVQGVVGVDDGVSVVVPLITSVVLAVVMVDTSVVFDPAVVAVGTSVLGPAELGTVIVLEAAVVGTVVFDTVVFGSDEFEGEATVVLFESNSSA